MARPEKWALTAQGHNNPSSLAIDWQERMRPLVPEGMAGLGPVATRLAMRLLQFPEEQLSKFIGVAGKDILIVLAPAEQLPWVDGAEYLGKDPEEPGLLLPTTRSPVLQPGMMTRALEYHFQVSTPVAVLAPDARDWMVVPLISALPVASHILRKWLEARR